MDMHIASGNHLVRTESKGVDVSESAAIVQVLKRSLIAFCRVQCPAHEVMILDVLGVERGGRGEMWDGFGLALFEPLSTG